MTEGLETPGNQAGSSANRSSEELAAIAAEQQHPREFLRDGEEVFGNTGRIHKTPDGEYFLDKNSVIDTSPSGTFDTKIARVGDVTYIVVDTAFEVRRLSSNKEPQPTGTAPDIRLEADPQNRGRQVQPISNAELVSIKTP